MISVRVCCAVYCPCRLGESQMNTVDNMQDFIVLLHVLSMRMTVAVITEK